MGLRDNDEVDDDPEAALATLRAAIDLRQAAGDRRGQAAAERELLARCARLYGDADPRTARARGELSATLRGLGELGEALALATRALDDLRAASGDAEDEAEVATATDRKKILEVASAWGNLSAVHRARLDHAAALAAGTRALDLRRRILGDDPRTAVALTNLGTIHAAAGDLDQALACEREALDLRRRILAADDPELLGSLAALATLHRNLGNLTAALALQREAAAGQAAVFGASAPATVESRRLIAFTLVRVGRRAEALHETEALLALLAADDPRADDLRELRRQLLAAIPGGKGRRTSKGKGKGKGTRKGKSRR